MMESEVWKRTGERIQGKGAPTPVGCYFFLKGGKNTKNIRTLGLLLTDEF